MGMLGAGCRLERERCEKCAQCSLLGFDVCFPTHLRLGLPSIFWCCIPCSECCNLLCVGLNVHILVTFHTLYVSYNECVPAVLLEVLSTCKQ